MIIYKQNYKYYRSTHKVLKLMTALARKARLFFITILIIALFTPFFLAPHRNKFTFIQVYAKESSDFPTLTPSKFIINSPDASANGSVETAESSSGPHMILPSNTLENQLNRNENEESNPRNKTPQIKPELKIVPKPVSKSPIKLPESKPPSAAQPEANVKNSKISSPILSKPVELKVQPATKPTVKPATIAHPTPTHGSQSPSVPAQPSPTQVVPVIQDPLLNQTLQQNTALENQQNNNQANNENWQEEAFESLGEDLPGANENQQGQKFSFLDEQPATVTYIPGYGFDYRSYPEKLNYLQKRITRLRDAMESSLSLDITIDRNDVASLVKGAEVEKTKFEYYSQTNKIYEAGKAYGKAVEKLNTALLKTSISPTVEGRAIWLDRGSIVDAETPARLKKVLRRIHDAGINVVYFETINAGFPIYPSKLTKQNPLTEDWDPLEVAIKEGHKLGMEIHAWVWVFAVGNRRHNPIIGQPLDYPGPMLVEGGMMSEAMRSNKGTLLPGGNQHEFWLSPASPKARKFLLDVFSEIVTNYDIDGLQLDYIRYPFQKPSVQMGYEPISRQRYTSAFGGNVDKDAMGEMRQRSWIAWKTYLVNSFVKETSERLRKIKPDIKISAAVFPMSRSSRIVAIHQDWETWIENGWIDTLSPMSYTTSPSKLMRTFNYVNRATKKHTMVYPGIAIHKIDAPDLLTQLDSVRSQGAMGSTLFAMAHLDENKIRVLKTGPYKEKNVVSPHQEPVKAMQSLLGNYRSKFIKLHEGDTPLDIPPHLNQEMTATLNNLHQTMAGHQHPQPQKKHSKSFVQALEKDLQALKDQNKQWVKLEYKKHPYRLDYFTQLLIRMERVLSYIKDRAV